MFSTTRSNTASFFVLVVSANGELRFTRGNYFVSKAAAELTASDRNEAAEVWRAQGWEGVYKVFSAEELNALTASGTLIGSSF